MKGMLVTKKRHLDLGQLYISGSDLVKSPSFFYRVLLAVGFPRTFRVLDIQDSKHEVHLMADLVKVDPSDSESFQSDFEMIKTNFLNDRKLGYYDEASFELEKFIKSMTNVESPESDEKKESVKEKTKEESEKRDKPQGKTKSQVEEEKREVAKNFYKLKLSLVNMKNKKTEKYTSAPFAFPGRLVDFFFSIVQFPNQESAFVFYNSHTGFDKANVTLKMKFQYSGSQYKLFDNSEKKVEEPVPSTEVNVVTKPDQKEAEVNGKNETVQGSSATPTPSPTQETKTTPQTAENGKSETTKTEPKDTKAKPSEGSETKAEDKEKAAPKDEEKKEKKTEETKENSEEPETGKNESGNQNQKESTKQNESKADSPQTKTDTENTKNTEKQENSKDSANESAQENQNNQQNESKETITEAPKADEGQSESAQKPVEETNSNSKPDSNENTPAPAPGSAQNNTSTGQSTETQNTNPASNNQNNSDVTAENNQATEAKPAGSNSEPVDPNQAVVDTLKDTLDNISNGIIENSEDIKDTENKVDRDGNLNENPDLEGASRTIQQAPPGSIQVRSITPGRNQSAVGSRLLQEDKSSKPTEKAKIWVDSDDSKDPHLIVYHFAIIDNFYGAIFDSQSSGHVLGHSITVEYFKAKRPSVESALIANLKAANKPMKDVSLQPFSPKINGCNSRCSIPLGESLKANSCLACATGVLNSSDHKCLQYCPKNLKNQGGICIECLEKDCSERPQLKMTIDREEEAKFLISLNQKILNMPKEDMKKFLKVELVGVKPEFYNYSIEPISDKKARLELLINETLYNKKLRVSLDQSKLRERELYDENYNEVTGLEESLSIGTMTYLKDSDKFWVDFLSYFVVGLFFLMLLCLLAFFIIHCRSDKQITVYVCKKMVRFICKVHFTAFLIFLNCQMSPQLRRFLKNIYRICVGFTQIFKSVEHDEYMQDLWQRPVPVYERHINFEEHEVFRYFLQNFGLIIIIHGVILVLFWVLAILKYCSRRSSKTFNGCCLRLKNVFSLNLLILFFLFQIPVYVFVFLNLKYLSFDINAFFTASSVLTLLYILAFFVFMSLIVKVFLRRNQLFQDSDDFSAQKFYSVSYYLLGFKASMKTFYFELIFVLFYVCHSVLLVFFYQWPSIHVLLDAALIFGFLLCILLLHPFSSQTEFVIEVLWLSALLVVYVALAFMAYLDLDNRNALFERNVIGWITVIILFVALFCYFAHTMYQYIMFFFNRQKNSKVTTEIN